MQGRLKASRSRVADLEKEVVSLKHNRAKLEEALSCQSEINNIEKQYQVAILFFTKRTQSCLTLLFQEVNIRYQFYIAQKTTDSVFVILQELKDKSEEDFQELLQFREKVNVKTKENADLQQEVEGLKHKLSVTATKLEQLTANGTEELSSQTEGLSQQVVALESHISSLNQQLKAMTAERDQTTIHYQQVVQQLNAQLANLATKEESTRAENDNLIVREQNLVKHIGALEKQLQNTQNIPIGR